MCMYVCMRWIMTGAKLENTNLPFLSMHSYTYMASFCFSSPQVNMVMRLKETPTKSSNKNIDI